MTRTRRRISWALAALACVVVLGTASSLLFVSASAALCASAVAYQNKSVWVELGTNSGPIPTATRSEPAHLLLWHDQAILIDAGDGAAEQLAKAHVALGAIRTIILSHLHFDHTGGLFAILGMRYQGSGPGCAPVTVYGPPGTKRLVDGLRAAIQPGSGLVSSSAPDFRVVEGTRT